MQAMAKMYGLQALVPKPDIKPHIQEAIAKVPLTAASTALSAVEQPAMPFGSLRLISRVLAPRNQSA